MIFVWNMHNEAPETQYRSTRSDISGVWRNKISRRRDEKVTQIVNELLYTIA